MLAQLAGPGASLLLSEWIADCWDLLLTISQSCTAAAKQDALLLEASKAMDLWAEETGLSPTACHPAFEDLLVNPENAVSWNFKSLCENANLKGTKVIGLRSTSLEPCLGGTLTRHRCSKFSDLSRGQASLAI